MTEPNWDTDPTPPLDEFRVLMALDDNLWWRVGCGHHLNLYGAAVDRYEDAVARLELVERQNKISADALEKTMEALRLANLRYEVLMAKVVSLSEQLNK